MLTGNLAADGVRDPPERIAQRTIMRAQALDAHAFAVEPCVRNARGDHKGSIRFTLVGKQIEDRSYEIRSDPAVRHVADETRFARIAADDFGPLIPFGRAPIVHEEIDGF